MKKFSKILALVLALICAFTTFVACNNEQADEKNKEDSIEVEYYVIYKGVKIELAAKADSVLSTLSSPKAVNSLGTCGPFGSEIEYVYDDITIYTIKNDSGETIDQIQFTNDISQTRKNICIGETSDKVIKAYGEPTVKTDSLIIYTKDCDGYKLHLKFGIEDGEISKINFIREFEVDE